ncbi:hypothetical protein JCGZ_05681 [Jatropha curcas]|uniref:Integral membrane bound transporter domain-containing protein n=1 Tax=Jatropha curcas TaxID=180498 RepID=A0A067LJ09_JATCU|nr:uncharacterized protein LOC105628356 [Jatropha curcas]KDP44214.1 hypothetical protein JCGZ_05681 [Jatropha curcas]
MSTPSNSPDRARAVWRWSLASAFRTGLACGIVGCASLYGPASLRHRIAFPAFSYVTVILIGTDATAGDALYGCWLAMYATVQTVGPAMLSLWLIGPARFSIGTISVAAALAAFTVVIPEGTHLIAKRIALGQIVILYVVAFINGVHTEPIMHPLNVAVSTAIGVLASILALLLPYPRLACWEVKENCKLLVENASERLKLYVKAFCEQDSALALSSISQSKSLAIAGTKLLQSIKRYQGSMKWERFPLDFLRPSYKNPGAKLQELEIPLKGMEMALNSMTSFPVRMLGGETTKEKLKLEDHVNLTVEQIKNCFPCDNSLTVPESKAETIIQSFQTLQTIPTNHNDHLSSLFFLFCINLLHCKPLPNPKQENKEGASNNSRKQESHFKNVWSNCTMNVNTKRVLPAVKCSLSLGFATLFGLLYSKENGFWSALPVAISFAAAREATFKVANVKAQGTVLGSVYGAIGCFVFERFLPIRFLSLLPWFILTSFLRRSRMYGQAGGLSAAIGAVLILGRKNFGPPSEFAMARITETFIGLSCSIMVELILQPTRAASLAKIHLNKSLGSLFACIGSISLDSNKDNVVDKQKILKLEVSELKKSIGEAEVEPNFWFLPFYSGCYSKLLVSLSKMVDLLLFSAHAVGFLEQESQKVEGISLKGYLNKLSDDVQLFKEMVGGLIKCLEDLSLLKSLTFLDKELENKNINYDPELGKSPNPKMFSGISGSDEEDEMEKIMNSFLQDSNEVVDKFQELEENEKQKSQLVLCLGALGFCMKNLIKEAREIEKGIQELIQYENPGNDISLHEISCKIHALYN